MEILGTLIKRGFKIRTTLKRVRRFNAFKQQRKVLLKLLLKSRETRFGKAHEFDAVLNAHDPEKLFQKIIPIHDYDSIYENWWKKSLNGEANICWPGKIKYFALSSGTSGAPSKHIPVTSSTLRSMRKTSIRQVVSLVNYDLPEEFFSRGVLVVGGTSDLDHVGHFYQGDLSGINQAKMPFWTSTFYHPGREIVRLKDWNSRIEEIVKNAKNWDIGMITGVPAWCQIILEKVIERYKVKNIHEIWPNLQVFIWGGVSIEPYRKSLDKLCAKPLHLVETYLASEGFFAYQSRKEAIGMELVLNNGIFFEFVPFNDENFSADGKIKANPKTLLIDEVEKDQEYALLISTNAGIWRYLIGDTIKFTNVKHREIKITGRTKHFLSLCGEHLSVDNMNKAIHKLSEYINQPINEYTVFGTNHNFELGHEWYIGIEKELSIDVEKISTVFDEFLCQLNDDYAVERKHALKNIKLNFIPIKKFYDYMQVKGKVGGQNKFPRVLHKEQIIDWVNFL